MLVQKAFLCCENENLFEFTRNDCHRRFGGSPTSFASISMPLPPPPPQHSGKEKAGYYFLQLNSLAGNDIIFQDQTNGKIGNAPTCFSKQISDLLLYSPPHRTMWIITPIIYWRGGQISNQIVIKPSIYFPEKNYVPNKEGFYMRRAASKIPDAH